MDPTPTSAIPIEQFQAASDASAPPGAIPVDQFQAEQPEGAIPIDQFESQDDHYGSGSQQAIAGLEGAAQGVAGPLATLAETKLLGVNPEDIAGREHANPWTHHAGEAAGLIGGYMSGAGELGLIARGAEAAATAAKFGKIGSMALKGVLEAAALQGSTEASHYITGYDPAQTASSALANMGYAGIMGGATGGLFGLGDITNSTGLKAIEDGKLVTRAEKYLTNLGVKTQEQGAEKIADLAVGKIGHVIAEGTGATAGAAIGSTLGGGYGATAGAISGYNIARKYVDPVLDKILKKRMTSFTQKYVIPPLTKSLTSGNLQGLPSAVAYGMKAAKGAKLMDKALDSVFIPGMSSVFNAAVDPQAKERVKQNIEDGVLDQQMQQPDSAPQFAKGGAVTQPNEDHFALAFPAENAMMQSAKARVYNHLKMLKPQQKQGLAFDHKAPTKEQERIYDQALDIATNPLQVINHLKNGSLSSSHILQMNQMWPELNDQLRKKVTERITNMQLEGKKPPYKIRQGLAILLGTALDSAMTPQGIMAAQAAFQSQSTPQSSQNSTGGKNKRGSASLSKAPQEYKTPNQAGEADQAVRK